MSSSTSSGELFIAGALSGIAEAVSVQPFDMVKTRHQLNTGMNEGVFSTMASLVKEGGIRRLYRGMLAELVGMVPKTSALYSSYELSRRFLATDMGYGDTTIVCFVSGIVASIPEAIIVTPSQVVKVRLQAKEHLGRFNGPWHCLVDTCRKEGFLALYTGLEPTLFRNCIWNSIYFGTMHWGKSKLKLIFPAESTQHNSFLNTGLTFVSGFCGATFATFFNAPFDVVKSRFQSQLHVPGVVPKYRNTLQALFLIYKEEGLKSCYKGFQPKVLRMGLGGAVAMCTFDAVQTLMTSFHGADALSTCSTA